MISEEKSSKIDKNIFYLLNNHQGYTILYSHPQKVKNKSDLVIK